VGEKERKKGKAEGNGSIHTSFHLSAFGDVKCNRKKKEKHPIQQDGRRRREEYRRGRKQIPFMGIYVYVPVPRKKKEGRKRLQTSYDDSRS